MKLIILAVLFLVNFANSAPTKEQLDFQNQLQNVREDNVTKFMVASHGYPSEEHFVTTPDGYILKVFRIPNPGKEVVFVQHGLLCSSADWVVTGPGKGLAYLLHDAGYDVWLGNARGNTHSRKHQYLSPEKREFWDFSWHEIGQIDLPAMIDFALLKTGKKQLHYIGHSQGTTAFFVMGSLRKEMNAKIKTMHALAPVAFMSNLVSPMLRAIAPFVDEVEWIMKMMGMYEFAPSDDLLIKGGKLTCKNESPIQEVCANFLFILCGFNSQQLNRTALPDILRYTPAGSSVNQLVHYGQGINSGKFRMYDYGLIKNLKVYGQSNPPDYNLAAVTAPVFLHYSGNDWMSAIRDVDELASKLGNLVGKFRVSDPKFNHLDYMWATNAPSLLYDRVISFIERYS